jgi:tRNA(Leu) C34 or U34 (ribose-2'-O)-methylase TrmL
MPDVPQTLPTSLEILNVYACKFPTLNAAQFSRYTQLRRLVLNHNPNVRTIDPFAFAGLNKLEVRASASTHTLARSVTVDSIQPHVDTAHRQQYQWYTCRRKARSVFEQQQFE